MRLFTILVLLFGLNLSSRAASIPPPGYFNIIITRLLQQLENTNIVLNSSADKVLKLRISKSYEIFDTKGKLVLKGNGKEIDISKLSPGKYTIKFDKDYNQIEYFTKK